ncbi:nucleoside recognition domain-containing protein [Limnoraphis robusta]|uniref:nucleoside recognition domain-containing protein n=1 Tax=Limnoraphis robusta TaxID=1118279 RepID=UPI003CC9F87D
MARAAFVMDRVMRFIGLPGKSFVPMLVGFGCNVPAIMATRTLENSRDRLMTIMMNPFMSCGARLPVYALFAAAFFPVGGQNIVFGLYLLGILAAIFTGLVMKHTLLKGQMPQNKELPLEPLGRWRSDLMEKSERLLIYCLYYCIFLVFRQRLRCTEKRI